MNSKATIALVLKVIIWVCLIVIMLSPLFVSSKLFFPFIVTKTVAFMICVEVMLAAWLLLGLFDANYRVRINLVVILAAVYLVILTIASLLGNDFYRSFWSNNERSDGILLLLHLFLFVLVLTSMFRRLKAWLYVIDAFLVGTFLVSLDALLQFYYTGACVTNPDLSQCHNWLMVSSNGARLAATIGNAGYVGGFMVFGIFLSVFMLFKRPQWWLKCLYGVLIALELFIAIQTQTRGAYLALAFGGAILAIYLLFFYYKNKWFKIAGVVIIAVGLVAVGSIFAFKDSSIVKNSNILNRVASIADTGGTANNRLVTWGFAWQGIKERPLLGYGQENFYQAFDKYYDTRNTEQWFDRAHNMIFDRTVTGGFLGLASYLSLLIVPFIFLWIYYFRKEKETLTKNEGKASKFFTPVIFSILIISYLIQNMFIFEALVIYIPLYTCLAFAGMYGPQLQGKFWENKGLKIVLAVLGVIFCVYGIFAFNLTPLRANRDLIKILSSQDMTLPDRINSFEDIISRNTLGNQEYRRQYYNFYENVMRQALSSGTNQQELMNNPLVKDFVSKMEKQVTDQIRQNPHSLTNYLMLINFYNFSYIFNPDYLSQAVEAFNTAKQLSPSRPDAYYAGAVSYYYLANYYGLTKQPAQAQTNYGLALDTFYQGADLNLDKGRAFDSLSGFLASVSNNPELIKYLKQKGIAGLSSQKLLDQLDAWIKEGDQSAPDENVKAQRIGSLMQLRSILMPTSSTPAVTPPVKQK